MRSWKLRKLGVGCAIALALVGAGVVGCAGGKSSVGEAVRPKEMKAGDALKGDNAAASECSASDDDRTLIVDLKGEDRKDMENMFVQGKVPVVAYDCKTFTLLRRCTIEAKFEYLGSSPRKNVRSIENSDAMAAEVPLASASLKASVNSGRKVDIALAEVGTRSSSFELVAKTELKGVGPNDCDTATHFVRSVDVGAFAIGQRSSGEAAAAAKIFAASASGESKSNVSSMATEGKVDACENAKESDKDAPEGCRVPLRVQLRRVVATSKEKQAMEQSHAETHKEGQAGVRFEPPCPPGKVRAEGGSCVPPSPNIKYMCRPPDVEECKTQCDKGHLGSCEKLGVLYLYGTPPTAKVKVERDPAAAVPILEKSCLKSGQAEPKGCSPLAQAYRYTSTVFGPHKPGEAPPAKGALDAERKDLNEKMEKALDYGCKRLDNQACFDLGRQHESPAAGLTPPDIDRAMHDWKRACGLGNQFACSTAARMYLEGKKAPDGTEVLKKDPQQGLAILDKACKENSTSACGQLGTYLTNEKYKVKDVKRADAVFQALCERKNSTGCAEHALLQLIDPTIKGDAKVAKETLETLCYDGNDGAACYGVAYLKENALAGTTEDKAKALEYYKKYSYLKDAAARAARILDTGAKGVTKNEAEAAELFGKACNNGNNGDVTVCKKAAEFAEKGPQPFTARMYLRNACTLGDKPSCDKATAPMKPPPMGAKPPPGAPPGPPAAGAPPGPPPGPPPGGAGAKPPPPGAPPGPPPGAGPKKP